MRESKIVSRLDEMLTSAMEGSFVESDYNETELSRLECKFRQYLTEKELSAERVRTEREAIGNLLDNAVKYSPRKSRVTIRVDAFEMFVRISVEDEGPGILEEERARIFERFYRGKDALWQEGNGVGLYLTRMILQKERGYIRVLDGGRGGSCFQVYLPVKA